MRAPRDSQIAGLCEESWTGLGARDKARRALVLGGMLVGVRRFVRRWHQHRGIDQAVEVEAIERIVVGGAGSSLR